MKAKNVIAFLLVFAIIVACAYVAAFDVKIGNFRVPSTFDKEKGIKQGLDLVGGSIIEFEPAVKDLSKVTNEDMDSAEAIIRNRLDANNLTEATISRQGKRIRVEIPEIDNPQGIVDMITASAELAFVDANGAVIMNGSKENVKKAQALYSQVSEYSGSEWHVELTFTKKGQEAFAKATEVAVNAGPGGNTIAIYLDGEFQMAPTVNEVINSSTCVITGGYTQEEAEKVATLINSGQLPFKLTDAEVRSVGPTLGSTALKTSLKAALIGLLLVMLFMIIVYRLPGLVASISLVAYVSIVTLILAGFFVPSWRGFVTLTLPGIAGVILSIGMAVDANCVIFERIKDELRQGKSVGASVNSGFKRALVAIIDSNITTIIASVVLYLFGTGTVKGFAITLFIGVVVSMLTAVTLTKFLLKQIVGFGIKNPALYGLSKRRDAE